MVWLKHFHNLGFFFLWELNFSLVLTSCSYVRSLSIAVQFPPTLHAATQCTFVASLYVSIIFPLGRLVFYLQQSLKPIHQAVTHLINPISCRATKLCVSLYSFTSPWKDCILLAFWDNLQSTKYGEEGCQKGKKKKATFWDSQNKLI